MAGNTEGKGQRWEVQPWRDDATGRCWVECPVCPHVARAMTEHGVMEAIVEHMNADHYRPPRGNA